MDYEMHKFFVWLIMVLYMLVMSYYRVPISGNRWVYWARIDWVQCVLFSFWHRDTTWLMYNDLTVPLNWLLVVLVLFLFYWRTVVAGIEQVYVYCLLRLRLSNWLLNVYIWIETQRFWGLILIYLVLLLYMLVTSYYCAPISGNRWVYRVCIDWARCVLFSFRRSNTTWPMCIYLTVPLMLLFAALALSLSYRRIIVAVIEQVWVCRLLW